jgi:DNA-binding NarL/FixJ family response regulator
MRVLIADRNARLLESISRTFAHEFSIQTATTRKQGNDLLLRGEFDLAVISEKLADGPGLQLLAQIARNSPDTLRVFAARRSRLQLLKGKLGPFGLFRTLAYPIDPQKLLSALTLARAGLEIEVPAVKIRNVSIEERQAAEVPATREKTTAPLRAPHAGASVPGPAAIRPTVERISLTSADATFAVNVPMTIASMRRVRRSNLSLVSQPANVAPESPSEARQPQETGAHLQSIAPRLTQNKHLVQQSAQSRRHQRAETRGGPTRSLAQTPRLGSPLGLAGLATAAHPRYKPQLARTAPMLMRTKVVLGATIVAVFLVTTLTRNLFDASAHVTQSSATRPEIAQPDVSAPPLNSAPAGLTPAFRPKQSVAQRAEPRPDATKPDVEPADPQMAASTAPIADPSTFGSEAYEPIYSN